MATVSFKINKGGNMDSVVIADPGGALVDSDIEVNINAGIGFAGVTGEVQRLLREIEAAIITYGPAKLK